MKRLKSLFAYVCRSVQRMSAWGRRTLWSLDLGNTRARVSVTPSVRSPDAFTCYLYTLSNQATKRLQAIATNFRVWVLGKA